MQKAGLLPKVSVTTGRTCLMIVRGLRVLPVLAPVADCSDKNRIEVIASATLDKRKFDEPVVFVRYIFFKDSLPLATCGARRNRTSVLRLPCTRRWFALRTALIPFAS